MKRTNRIVISLIACTFSAVSLHGCNATKPHSIGTDSGRETGGVQPIGLFNNEGLYLLERWEYGAPTYRVYNSTSVAATLQVAVLTGYHDSAYHWQDLVNPIELPPHKWTLFEFPALELHRVCRDRCRLGWIKDGSTWLGTTWSQDNPPDLSFQQPEGRSSAQVIMARGLNQGQDFGYLRTVLSEPLQTRGSIIAPTVYLEPSETSRVTVTGSNNTTIVGVESLHGRSQAITNGFQVSYQNPADGSPSEINLLSDKLEITVALATDTGTTEPASIVISRYRVLGMTSGHMAFVTE